MKRLEITTHSIVEIENLLKSKEDYRMALRLLCVLQIAKGGTTRDAEDLLYLSHNQVAIWVKRFNQDGIKGLEDKKKTGKPSRVSQDQLFKLKQTVLEQLPSDFGYNSATWTAPLIASWIKQEFNIDYTDDAIYIILKKKLGLRHIKGKGFYPESNPEEREAFVDRLKKTP